MYQDVCQKSSTSMFLTGYDQGKEILDLQNKINSGQKTLTNDKTQIEKLNSLKKSLIYNQKLTPQGRQGILSEIETLSIKLNKTNERIENINKLKTQLNNLEAESPYPELLPL